MRVLAALTFMLLPLAVMAQDNPVIARMTAFVQAFNAQDADAVARFYAPDAVLLAPGQKSIVGRKAIAAHYAAAFAQGTVNLQFKTFDIRPFGRAATEIGETVVRQGTREIVGRYMHLWEISDDGKLLLTRDMYHVLAIR